MEERLDGPGGVDAVRRLDVDDGGTEVAQGTGRCRARQRPREVEDAKAVERRSPASGGDCGARGRVAPVGQHLFAVFVQAGGAAERAVGGCAGTDECPRGANR